MKEPKFIPKPGQVDYTDIRYSPVVNIVVVKAGKILLVQRNKNLRLYPGHWATVDGYLDDSQSLEEKALEELREELDIKASDVANLKRGQPIVEEAPEYNKTWIIMPVMATLNTEKFKLNDENEDAGWFRPDQLSSLKLLPKNLAVIEQFIKT